MDGEKTGLMMLYGGSGSAVYFAWGDFIGMAGGIFVGLVGLAITYYFQRRRDKREQAEHERRMKGSS